MSLPFFITILFALQVIYWIVGKISSRKSNMTEDYFLAGKSVSFFPLMMTFLATQVGGGVILGSAEEAYRYGWAVLLYPIGAALGLIALGAGVGRRLAAFPVSTIAELFELVYQSRRLRQAASLLSIISLFMILVAQIIASHKFMVSIGMVSTPLFLLFWGIVILYTSQGGLKAVISTDLVQAAFFSVVFMAAFLMVGSSTGIFLDHPGTFEEVSPKLCSWLLMPLLFMFIEQDMGQRCFAGGSPKIVSRATLAAGLIMMVICIVPVFFGVLAKEQNLSIPAGASVIMTAIEATTGPWMAAVVGCAVLAAVISTATSLINAISSNLFYDFKLEAKRGLIASLVSFGAIFAALNCNSILDILTQSYELSISCLFVPVVFALMNRSGGFFAALFAIILGALGFVLFRFAEPPFPREIVNILLSLAGYGLGWGIQKEKIYE